MLYGRVRAQKVVKARFKWLEHVEGDRRDVGERQTKIN
jgi:hypothetical protein